MPDVKPIIADLQSSVNALTSGGLTKAQITDDMARQLLKDRPDVAAEFVKASSQADKNSPVFKQKGLDRVENYARYWYTQMGGNSSYKLGETPPTPAQTADSVVKPATDATTNLVNTFTDLTKQLTTQIGQTQTDTTKLISGLQTDFANQQTSLLQGFEKAQAAQAAQMAELTKAMQAAALGGQERKRPNYGAALARNKQLNSGGLSATMLTGPTGVSSGAMTLGRTNLLGG